ncbi:hypothetical protein V8B55DRAFT_1466266 [Mucor lusitanicus]|uniref:GAR domain-containing protein n=3 Tax=Mucor TaxID=4830 RepID=A0A168JHX4_MUCCL|nr:hypothetical protein FB192DRAFT_1356094 [Mucor lusitanicus]OAD01216.1 hypothetical protein MUCCIDRAFT_184908 [Mucor lusitanicus CBS 277.49]
MATTAIDQIGLPDKEVQKLFQFHDSLSDADLTTLFPTATSQLSNWLQSIHLAVFTMEQNVQKQHVQMQDLKPLESAMERLEPFIQTLPEISELIPTNSAYMTTTKIQSEWSSLQHFLASVKKLVFASQETHSVATTLNQLLAQMDDVSLLLFDFQEKKHHAAVPTSSLSERAGSESTNSFYSDSETTKHKDDQAMADLDALFEPLFNTMEHMYHRMAQQEDPVLQKRFDKVKDKWDSLQYERDELKWEHKEDRWLTVFRRVADQVDVMIDGLDRSVVQCYSLIQHMRDWQATQLPVTPTSAFDKFSKALRLHPKASPPNTPPPVDKEKFRSVEKSFEAKYKYYTPSIDRMLAMLGNGISARASRDNQTSQRHDSMLQRWHHLKEVMDELRMRDLAETERMLSSSSSVSSASSSPTDSNSNHSRWRGIRYRTPEPSNERHEWGRVRSVTPNHALGRSSPRKSIPNSPQTEYYQQSLLRGSISDSSSVGSSPPPKRQTKTPRPTRNSSTLTTQQEDFYDADERDYGVDLMKLSKASTGNTSKRSPSSLGARPATATAATAPRSKTPNPPTHRRSTAGAGGVRSKSSMGDISTRTMSPSFSKRSVTPSLIPRPKTPTSRYGQQQKLPPVPPIPKYVSHRKPDISVRDDCIYRPDPKDALDVEVAHIVNASPISIQCQRAQPGRYYFGNELSMSSMGGKKMYTCKLMTYADRRGGQFKNNKVLIRVGGGWQDLEFFLLEHSSLMASDVVVRSFGATGNTNHGWRN